METQRGEWGVEDEDEIFNAARGRIETEWNGSGGNRREQTGRGLGDLENMDVDSFRCKYAQSMLTDNVKINIIHKNDRVLRRLKRTFTLDSNLFRVA